MQHYYEHGRNPIGLGHPARLLRWRYGPAGDSAPRLRQDVRQDIARLESRLDERINGLESHISDLRERMAHEIGELRERMAKLEGLLEGLREAISGRSAAS